MANSQAKKRILVLVEGERMDVRLMKRLFRIYDMDAEYEVISYNTNIYVLYDDMFLDGEPDAMDLVQVLKMRERDPTVRKLLDDQYTDILLIFDLDPQDGRFSEEKILAMIRYFSESSDMGKLYINYPMVEAFYHMKSIPDPDYCSRIVSFEELRAGKYKARVNAENRNRNYSKFAVDRHECNVVIAQNLEKAWLLTGAAPRDAEDRVSGLNREHILEEQLILMEEQQIISVLCTCVFFIPEYNPRLIETT